MIRKTKTVNLHHKRGRTVYTKYTNNLLESKNENLNQRNKKLNEIANLQLMALPDRDDYSSSVSDNMEMVEDMQCSTVLHATQDHLPAEQHAAARILQLSRRVRHLSADLEVQKSLRKAAESKLRGAQPPVLPPQPSTIENDNSGQDANKVKLLTSKLKAANLRLFESQNKCQQLKHELRLVQKALEREAGDTIATTAIVNRRGRAQQILALQQKVAELQEQLKGQEPERNICREDSRASLAIRQIEHEKRIAYEQACQQLNSLTHEYEDTRRKMEAGRARIRNLEAEITEFRNRVSSLIEKDHSNTCLVAELTRKIQGAEKQLLEKQQEICTSQKEWQSEKQKLVQEIIQEKSRKEELQLLLETKNTSPEKLRDEMKSSSKILKDEPSRVMSGEVQSHGSASDTLQTEIPACKSSSTINQQEYLALSLAGEAERTRLLELVSVLNQRLDQQRQHAQLTEDTLRKERYRSARLEAKLERLELERAKATKVSCYRTLKAPVEKDSITEDLKNRLELSQEEVLVLKTKLQNVQQERDQDLRVYKDILAHTRSTYQKSSHCHGDSPTL